MGKKDKKVAEDATSAVNPASKETKKPGIEGSVQFDSSDSVIEAAKTQLNLPHVNKPWTRDAWERARPWVLEQRQKLESNGWSSVDCLRTELFVLKKPAPPGAYTDDGFVYIRIPKKFIDFYRSGKSAAGEEAGESPTEEGEDVDKKKKKSSRVSKKKGNTPSYELQDSLIWKLKIDGANSEELGREPNVCLDVMEPMENIFYLVMTLQPGLIKLHAHRKDVVQAGTKQSSARDDVEMPTVRHTAMVASVESYTRSLPPPHWFKRHTDHLRRILSATGNIDSSKEYDATAAVAETNQVAATREIKDLKEISWEEELMPSKLANVASGKGGAAAAANGMKKSKKVANKEVKEAVAVTV
ncbi:hypothetical protein CBS101457_003384 [Exobasidium rhododendri]|nr:hypothetical protein CBS101457_003384 [Exobasidium rhododendri]